MKLDEIVQLLKNGAELKMVDHMTFKHGKLKIGRNVKRYYLGGVTIRSSQFEAVRNLIYRCDGMGTLMDITYKHKNFMPIKTDFK